MRRKLFVPLAALSLVLATTVPAVAKPMPGGIGRVWPGPGKPPPPPVHVVK